MREDIALALDGSAIVLIALALWLAFQHRSWPGVLFGVVGLTVMSGTAALRAYPNPNRGTLQETATALRAEVEAATERWRKADGTAQELEQKLLRAEEKGREIQKKLTGDVEAKLLQTKTAETLRGELGEARREADEARRETDKVRSAALARLRSMIAVGLSTKFYEVAAVPERELILGKSGTYYNVRLKDRGSGAQFVFPKGRYSVPASETAILEAIDRFALDVLQTLNAAADHQVYVRGGADAEPLVGSGEMSPEYSAITYRVLTDGGKYARELSEQPFRAPISNKDLPVLRAAYFRSVIARKLAAYQLEILDNAPSAGLADEDRTVEIILYVDW